MSPVRSQYDNDFSFPQSPPLWLLWSLFISGWVLGLVMGISVLVSLGRQAGTAQPASWERTLAAFEAQADATRALVDEVCTVRERLEHTP